MFINEKYFKNSGLVSDWSLSMWTYFRLYAFYAIFTLHAHFLLCSADESFQYVISTLEQIGCARARRQMAMRPDGQRFPSSPLSLAPIPMDSLQPRRDENPQRQFSIAFSPSRLPACREDRPDLYTQRQCIDRDCFCVNSTTGIPFTGTWTGPEDRVDCDTAVLIIHLAVYQNEPMLERPTQAAGTFSDAVHDDGGASSYWEPRIVKSLKNLCQSAEGYQRVANIRRISLIDRPWQRRTKPLPSTNGIENDDVSRMVLFEVKLLSTGHGKSLQTTMDLINHRLDEAYLEGVGALEPNASFIELKQLSIEDPEPVFLVESGMDKPTDVKKKNTAPEDGAANGKTKYASGNETERQSGSLTGTMLLDSNSMQLDYPEGRQGRPLSPRQTAADLTKQNSWRRRDIFNQPGVIAGVVGSTIAGVVLVILLILFCIYRLRKKDEGSYSLEEPKKSPSTANPYIRTPSREFYA